MLLRVAATMVAVWLAAYLVPGISVGSVNATGDATANHLLALAVIAIVIGLVNSIVKPIAEGLSGCLVLLTLGLFLLVVNAAMLFLSAWISRQLGIGFEVSGWGAAIIGSLIISLVSGLINGLTGVNRKDKQ